jgi:hypothetical protein
MQELVAAGCEVMVYTCRCSHEPHPVFTEGFSVERSSDVIAEHLLSHGFPKELAVWVGRGKPFADFYIDNCAIRCCPQTDPDAWPRTVAGVLGSVRACHGWGEHLGWRIEWTDSIVGSNVRRTRAYLIEGYCPTCGTFLPAKGPVNGRARFLVECPATCIGCWHNRVLEGGDCPSTGEHRGSEDCQQRRRNGIKE